ncbi:MAG: hypothetical protein QM719_05200 [Thermomonas sp.]
MRTALLAVAIAILPLAGCKQQQAAPATPPADASATSNAPAAPAARKHRLTKEDIARIEATGKTGFWSDVTEVCTGAKRVPAMLTWNVRASGAEKVILFVDSSGNERHFGTGGPVGEQRTGPWLRPGMVFKLRNAKDKVELGSIVIVAKQC